MIRVTGLDNVLNNLNKLAFDMEKAASETVFVVGNMVRNTAVLSIQNESPGHVTFRTRQGGGTYEHMAADKGNAPNTDTGRLASSIAFEFTKGDLSGFVGTTVEYGAHLEFGGWAWLEPAKDKHSDDLFIEMKKSLQRQVDAI